MRAHTSTENSGKSAQNQGFSGVFSDLVIDSNISTKSRREGADRQQGGRVCRVKGKKKKRGMVFVPYDYEAAFNKSIEDIHEYFVEQMLKNRYKCVYALKEITAGEQFEIEIYPEFKTMDDVPKAGKPQRDNSKAQKNLNDKNARKYVERLLNHNFGDSEIGRAHV